MVGLGGDRSSGIVDGHNSRNRLKSRLQSKMGLSLSSITSGGMKLRNNLFAYSILLFIFLINNIMLFVVPGPRRNIGITDLNRRINDLKMESGTPTPKPTSYMAADVQTRLLPQTQINRRDSNNSTVSSYYGTMSRKSSQTSQISAISTMRQGKKKFLRLIG